MASYKKKRATEQLKNFLSAEFRHLSDPRLQFVSVSEVQLSPDLRYATVYWTAPSRIDSPDGVMLSMEEFPSKEQRTSIDAGLKKAAKFLRSRVGEELDMKFVPELTFQYDDSAERGSRIDYLLNKANEKSFESE